MAGINKGLKVDDRVIFVETASDMDGRTGTVLGTSFDHIMKCHIVLMDQPYQRPNGELEKAVSITEACLERTDMVTVDFRYDYDAITELEKVPPVKRDNRNIGLDEAIASLPESEQTAIQERAAELIAEVEIENERMAALGCLTELYRGIKLPEGTVFGEFKPCVIYHEIMDWFEYLEEDCTTVTEYQKGSNIALLRKWDGHKYCGIVGIKIEGFSQIVSPELVEAIKADQEKRRAEWRSKIEGR